MRDGAGEGGASLLAEDALTVELRAGPPAQLSVEGPSTLEVGTKASLPQLRVRVCDSAGNPTTSETFEVGRAWAVETVLAAAWHVGRREPVLSWLCLTYVAVPVAACLITGSRQPLQMPLCPTILPLQVSLNSSALATDGSGRAASVSVSGGNKVKVKKGTAVFKDVRVSAEEAGSYALRIQSASRKVAVADGVLHLLMQVCAGVGARALPV